MLKNCNSPIVDKFLAAVEKLIEAKNPHWQELKNLFVSSNQSLQDSYNYVVRVSFKMRQYNLGASTIDDDAAAHEADDDVDVVDDGIEE